ncbi:Neuronal PAS domain-containing protein 4-like [Nymphon striatum]|nr:Neuronal PAS domain-containing protein 4-like [Nymphon striatum]
MMMTQNGKLLYISDNAAEYLGHSMVVLVEGHFVSFLPLCSRNEPVFLATCTPVAMPETRECVVQGSTNVYTSIHSMDMNFAHLDRNGEIHLGYTRQELQGTSWYQLLHWESMKEAQTKHRLITTSEQERSCIMLLRLQKRDRKWIWVHVVLQVKEGSDNSQQPVIVSTNQVLTEREAAVMRANSWLYHYYSVHSKIQYGLSASANYDSHSPSRIPTAYYPPLLPYHHSSHPESSPMSPYLPPPPPSFTNINGTSQQTTPVLQYGKNIKRSASPETNESSPVKWRRMTSAGPVSAPVSNNPLTVAVPQSVTVGASSSGPISVQTDSRAHLRSLHQRKLAQPESPGSEADHQSSVTPTNTEDVASWISLSASVNDEYDQMISDMNRPSFGVPGSDISTESFHPSANGRLLSDPLVLEKTQTFARLVQQYGSRLDDQTLKSLERSVFGDVLMQELHMLGQYLRQGPIYQENDPSQCLRSRSANYGLSPTEEDCHKSYTHQTESGQNFNESQKSPGCESRDSDYQSQTMSPSTPRLGPEVRESAPFPTVVGNTVMTSSPYYHSNHYMFQSPDYSSGLYGIDRGYPHNTSSNL